MKPALILAAFGIGTTLLCPAARADSFGSPVHVGVSAERMFGFATSTATSKQADGTESSTTRTGVGLLDQFPTSVYQLPRIGVDVVVVAGLTVGAALTYWTASWSETSGGQSQDGPTLQALVVNPRVGYALMFGSVVGIWPRLGFTYSSLQSSQTAWTGGGTVTEKDTTTASALSAEALLLLAPVDHLAFTVGPVLDVGLGGSDKTEVPGMPTSSHDVTTSSFGIQAGVLGYF